MQRAIERLVPALALALLAACGESVAAGPDAHAPARVDPWSGLEASTSRHDAESGITVTDGPVTLWNRAGQKVGEGELRQGERHGPWSFFHANGRLRWQGTFQRGVAVGPEKSWFDNGSLELEGSRVDGEREGTYHFYYRDGRLEMEVEFHRDLRHGTCRRWTPDGLPDRAASGVYENGHKLRDL